MQKLLIKQLWRKLVVLVAVLMFIPLALLHRVLRLLVVIRRMHLLMLLLVVVLVIMELVFHVVLVAIL